jgi:hypothetical protein
MKTHAVRLYTGRVVIADAKPARADLQSVRNSWRGLQIRASEGFFPNYYPELFGPFSQPVIH